MLDPELLALLVCPETHQDLTPADPEQVGRLNEAIQRGGVRNTGGKEVDQPVDGALIRADRAIAYPVRDDIPVMLVAEGLPLAQIGLEPASEAARHG
jgi:uncharacterized protein YbaR (Trm112 family)